MAIRASDITLLQEEKEIGSEARDYFIARFNKWIAHYKLGNWQIITVGYALKTRDIDIALHSYSFVERKVIVKFNYSYRWMETRTKKLDKKHVNRIALFCASILALKKNENEITLPDLLKLGGIKMDQTIKEFYKKKKSLLS